MVAKLLGFDDVCRNCWTGSTDFAIEFRAAAALIMMHISRFRRARSADEPRIGFIERRPVLHRSSIMPQKKTLTSPNLHVNCQRLYCLLTLMKGQPLATTDNQKM